MVSKDEIALHLSGEDIAIYQVALSALSALAYRCIDSESSLIKAVEMTAEWQKSWDDQNSLSVALRENPQRFWEQVVRTKTGLTESLWGDLNKKATFEPLGGAIKSGLANLEPYDRSNQEAL